MEIKKQCLFMMYNHLRHCIFRYTGDIYEQQKTNSRKMVQNP